MTRFALPALAVAVLLSACASIAPEEKALMTAPIDCARAPEQIAALQAARPNDLRKLRAVGSTIGAAGLAVGIATNDIADRERIASGAYGAEIDARIAEIRTTCGLPGAPAAPAPMAG